MDTDFTFENVERVAQAFSDHLYSRKPTKAPRIVIGYDWRKNSENFAKTFSEVLLGNGIEVLLSSAACPTPAVSYAIVSEHLDAGIAVTASHNPPGYNGIKIKTDFGGSADKDITDAVETFIGKNPIKKKTFESASGAVTRNLNEKYLRFLQSYLKVDEIKKAPYRVLVDSMHGVGDTHIQNILSGGAIKVTTIRGHRDITFGGSAPEPIPHNLGVTIERMKKKEFDLAVVTDGDADRIGAVRPGGEFISPGIILTLIMLHMVQDLKKTGSVVTTISNTALIYKAARKLGLKVHETPVGFKYVCEIMRKENVLIGGEESGGIGFQGYLYERDGLLSALLLMEMMAMRKKSFEEILADVEKEFGKLYYVRNDINYPNELKPRLFDHLKRQPPKEFDGHRVKEIKSQDGVKFVLTDDSWLLFRLSGTEPILRIYSEATSQSLAEMLVGRGKDLAFNLPS